MQSPLAELTKYTLLIVGALFPIVNPIGSAPLFLTLTRGISRQGRAVLSRMIALNGLALILSSIFVGTYILDFFGISLPVVQVSGGLVLVAAGWNLLRRPDDEETPESENKPCNEMDYRKQAFYPLTLPLTVGPGTISVAITLGANRPEGGQWAWPVIGGMLIGSVAIALSIYLSYRSAERLAEVLGDAAMNVFIRLSSFILLCIGVQIFWNGVKALLREAWR
ncbi:MAG TPA: MarC family protein [Bryobacteraceae bacterium]|jgi:multiple antibiotic resistance protein